MNHFERYRRYHIVLRFRLKILVTFCDLFWIKAQFFGYPPYSCRLLCHYHSQHQQPQMNTSIQSIQNLIINWPK